MAVTDGSPCTVLAGKLTRKQCEKPWNGKQLRIKIDLVQMIGQIRVMEGDELGELAQVLLNNNRIVLEEEVVQKLGHKGRQAGESLS